MALKSFRVENEKAVRLAACDAVPPVMIVAGPNGVGKSTLLFALHRRVGVEFDPETRMLYQPPHRAIRRQQVQRRWLSGGGVIRRIFDVFSNQSVEGFEGLNIPFPRRAPDNVDEAGSTLKFTLGRLENRRQAVLAALVDQHSAEKRDVKTGDLLDMYEPIRRLTARLLPHLFSELQARLLGYLREEAARSGAQFVVTTHSPTLVDQALDDELYLLGFPSGPGENQLRRVASTAQRLEALRTLAGSTFVITTGRTIVCIEGVADPATESTDLRLLETLHPAASRYTFVPVGGKGNVIGIVAGLRGELAAADLKIRVTGLVDRDRSESPLEGVVAWPVCMIENLLLDADALAHVTSAIREESIATEAVETALAEEAAAHRHDEIALRVSEALGAKTIRPKGATYKEVRQSLGEAIADLQFAQSRVEDAIETEQEVRVTIQSEPSAGRLGGKN